MNIALDFTVDTSEPLAIARTPQGEVLFANGLDPIRLWKGRGTATMVCGFPEPTGTPVLAGSGAGSLSGAYTCYYRWQDSDGKYSNFSNVSAEVTVTSVAQIDYTVPYDAATPARATTLEIYRNTSGSTATYYLDASITLSGSGPYYATSTSSDPSLSLQANQSIDFPDGQTAAFRFTPPPAKRSLVWHRERMFYAGDTYYREGHLETAAASTTVTGIGTRFTAAMVGRLLYFEGSSLGREITAVASATSLTVDVAADATSKFQRYTIQPTDQEMATIYWSYLNEVESVAATQSYVIDEDNDRMLGLLVLNSELFILKKHNTFRFPVQRDPFNDGQIYQAHYRGCASERAWCTAEGTAYLLDREGIYRFTGGAPEQISQPIQNYFRESGINWDEAKWFHAAALPYERTVRFYVNLKGQGLPRHAFAYNYETGVWWIEDYPFPVGDTTLVEIHGHQRLIVGTDGYRMMLVGGSHLDYSGGAGTNYGQVTAAGPLSLTDDAATFDEVGLVGYPIVLARGPGKGQVRRIASVDVDTGRIDVDVPWNVLPTTASYYQIGGIKCLWRTPLWQEVAMEGDGRTVRRFRLSFDPTVEDSHVDVRTVYHATRTPDYSWLDDWEPDGMRRWIDDEDFVELVTSKTVSGVGLYSGQTDTNTGYNHFVVDGNRGDTGPRSYRWVGFDMQWVTGPSGRSVYGVGVDGVA